MKLRYEGFDSCARLISFSDSVFSIAITLCVIQVLPVDLSRKILHDGVQSVLMELWPDLLGVTVTFIIVGLYWLAHHRIFNLVEHGSKTLTQINLVFLLMVSFMPFAVKISGARNDDLWAVLFYAAYMALTGFFLYLLWRHALRNDLVVRKLRDDRAFCEFQSLRLLVTPTVFLLSIPLAFFNPVLSRIIWLLALFSRRISLLFVGGCEANADLGD